MMLPSNLPTVFLQRQFFDRVEVYPVLSEEFIMLWTDSWSFLPTYPIVYHCKKMKVNWP